MIHVLSGRDRTARKALFDRLFRLRHNIFITKRGWSLPSRENMEIDQYDTDEAFYFVGVDDDGNIQSHVRMTPTICSSLSADYFPHLYEGTVAIRSPLIFEATRYMILPSVRDRQVYKQVRSELLTALVDWCLSRGHSHLQTVIDAGALRSFVELTLLTTPMGLPHPFGGGKTAPGGGECLAFRWPITERLLSEVRADCANFLGMQTKVA